VEATKDTLVLLIDPNSYFNEIFRNQPNFTVTADTIQQLRKYIRLNKFVPQSIAEAMADRAFVYVNQAIEWSEQAIAQRTAEADSIEQWAAVFSEKVPLDASSLLKKSNRPEPVIVTAEPQGDQSFFDTLPVEEPATPPVKFMEPEPLRPVEMYTAPTPAYSPPVTPPPMPPTLHESVGGNGNAAKESLNERFRTEQPSISSNFQRQPIASISQNIPLHQKFMFIHQLFGGSNSAYESAITELEQAPDFQSARGLITYKFASQHLWDMTGDTVGELLEIVKRRFGQS
jgi:hypothetical protein